MNKWIKRLEELDAKIENLESLCTDGAQKSADKLNSQVQTCYRNISKSQKAIDEYESRYAVTWEWED